MNLLKVSSLLAAIGVALGAFGAHALKDKLALSGLTETWKTAVFYHLVHAVALFALSLSAFYKENGKRPHWAANLWIVGIALFSGSLYALCFTEIRILGAITPFGGVALITGWCLLAFAKKK